MLVTGSLVVKAPILVLLRVSLAGVTIMELNGKSQIMHFPNKYKSDIKAIMAGRYSNGGDYWATTDGRLAKGHPFSTQSVALTLAELGVSRNNPALKGCGRLILESWREDGRFRLAPSGTLYPCYTGGAARTLCRLGYASDARLNKTFQHLLEIQHTDGGWRCEKFFFGRGPETEFSNPEATLGSLDAFRYTELLNTDKRLDKAVESLLRHWVTRKPIGPCHYGIGTLFMQVEYPFFRYNLFFYTYVLSFYNKAKTDKRFLEALACLESKLADGKIIVENPHRKLAQFSFCRKGQPSDIATERYREILKNVKGGKRK
jgi:hypothetical protein